MKKYQTEDDYDMIPLNEAELEKALDLLPDWQQKDEKWIMRQYAFETYLDGVNFAKRIGEYSEKRLHHPMIKIYYKKVVLEISSWRAKGITALDIEMVKDFNAIYDSFYHDK